MSYTPDEKVKIVSAWFNEINGTIDELKNLSKNKYYTQIAAPTLCSLLERMGWFRYRLASLTSSARFKKLLLSYSDINAELEKIDIAFLYQCYNSTHQETKKDKKNTENVHGKIMKALTELYGEISTSMRNRFIDANILYQNLLEKSICPDCLPIEKITLFSVYEMIYKFGRCKIVHEGELVAVGFIDITLLMRLTQNIAKNLKNACLENKKLADEL